MMLQIPQALGPSELSKVRAVIDGATWVDGNLTSGIQARLAKNNLQLPFEAPAREAGAIILKALDRNPLFFSAALPQTTLPPLFNRYGPGQEFKAHIDNAIRPMPGKPGGRLRADLSATLFLTEPDNYEGGALTVQDALGTHQVKLAAGDLILYPSSSIHWVTPVTRGTRTSAFFWIQSLIRDQAQRGLLFDMDLAIQNIAQRSTQDDPAVISLTGAYHNLLRMWADP